MKNFDFDSDSGWQTGRNGTVMEFDGSDDFVQVKMEQVDTGDEVTVSGWFYRDTAMSTEIALNKEKNWRLIAGDISSSKISARLGNSGSSWIDTGYVGDASIPKEEWVHAAMTADESTGKLKLYFNGKLDSTHDFSSDGTFDGNGTDDVFIGDYTSSTS